MPDLALLVTQLLLANKTLVGPSPDQLVSEVPYKDVLRATKDSLDELMTSLPHDTRNVLLTYARMWAMLMTDAIYPKPEAALWAIAKLPNEYKSTIAKARAIYAGEELEDWSSLMETAQHCAQYMKKEIEKRIEYLRSHENSNRKLRIQET
jgi:streptomycin 3"-adenylyltransferase